MLVADKKIFFLLAFAFICGLVISQLAGCGSAHASVDNDRADGWAAAIAGIATMSNEKAPDVLPEPKPGDKCSPCNGTGRVGDGRVSSECLDCNGTGVVPAKATVTQACDCDDCECIPCECSPEIVAPLEFTQDDCGPSG